MARVSNQPKIDTLQSVELSEGVEIQLRIAGVFARSLAYLLDLVFIIIAASVLGFIVGVMDSFVGSNYAMGLYGLLMFILTWGYFFLMESGKKGATFGKRIVGLRVVNTSGGIAQRGQVFTRNLFRFVELVIMPLIGLCCTMMTKRFQRAGDLVAGTVVVYAETDVQPSVALNSGREPRPPGWKLLREEQAAIVAFRERGGLWSGARQAELASHAQVLVKGESSEAVTELVGMAEWLTAKKD